MRRDPQWEFSQKILGLGVGPIGEILPAGKLTPAEALEVYESGYYLRLCESLQENYRATHFCLGNENFTKIAMEFIKKFPSRSYSLSHYGENFPQYLKNHAALASYPFLAELASFDWQFCELFHAPLEPAGDLDLSQATTDFSLKLVGHLRTFQCRYGILNLWNASEEENENMPAWDKPQNMILYRAGTDLKLRELSLAEFHLLNFLQQSKPLSICVDNLTELDLKITETVISNLFSFLASEGLIHSIAVKCDAK